ncbi:MAG: short-chain dehydrogenase, partial [Mycobacterium sp.]
MRTAVVTGGASGIGAAVVSRLRAAGHRVAIIDL